MYRARREQSKEGRPRAREKSGGEYQYYQPIDENERPATMAEYYERALIVLFPELRMSLRIHSAVETAVAFALTYALAFAWNLDRPFWAGFTVLMVSLPSIGQSLQKGVLRMFGTLIGAAIGLVFLSFFAQERMLLFFVLSVYMCGMLFCMLANAYYSYVFFISCIVTLIIVLMAVHQPQDAFYLSVYRTEETMLGIAVYTAVSLLIAPRTSLVTLRDNMRHLLEGHKALFDMNAAVTDTGEKMRRMYGDYVSMRDRVETTVQLIPAVRLENYQVYRYRDAWERAVSCSAELLELQRQWTGTLVALKDLDITALFPQFNERVAELGDLFAQVEAAGREESPAAPVPKDVPPLTFDKAAFDRLGSTRRGLALSAVNLFGEQVRRSRELLTLASALLHGGQPPAPEPHARPRPRRPLIKPEQFAYMSQMFVIFWVSAFVWIAFNPPGLGSIAFLELTILLGMIAVMTGEDKPLSQVFTFALGIVFAGLLYVFVYPLLTNIVEFCLLMGLFAFFMTILFSKREQNFTKQAFMLPWMSIGNFTNLPTYDFGRFLTGSTTLLLGISIISLIHYLFFMPNTQALFLQRQRAFFRSSEKLLRLMGACPHNRRSPAYRARLFVGLHRAHFLADEIALLSKKLPVSFVKPELARILITEIEDMAASLSGLRAGLDEAPADVPCLKETAGNAPTLRAQLESLQSLTQSMLDGLRREDSRDEAENAGVQAMIAACGGILKALSNTVDVMRSLPVEADARNRF